jgi:hypothetical protein
LNIAPMHDVCAIVPYVDDTLLQYLHTSARIERPAPIRAA